MVAPVTPERSDGWSRAHLMVLAIASAGWVFDVYEGQLFTIFKTPMLGELVGSNPALIDWHANVGFAAFLVGGAFGGLVFGVLGDRFGRVRMMTVTILVYSVFSALTSFVQEVWQVNMLRFLVALGTGGEWALAAAVVAETFPTRSRATASGIFHASSVIGSALAAITGMVLVDPTAWRWAFLLGLAPALLVVWIRSSLREPERWLSASRSDAGGEGSSSQGRAAVFGDLSELITDPLWRFRGLLGLGLATVGLATYWGIFAWGPELASQTLEGSTPAAVRQSLASRSYLVMNFTGGLLGLLAFAPLANWRGRRFAFAVYHVGAGIVTPVVFLGVATYNQALALLPVMAFFVLGMHAGYAIYFPELFPTRLRATGSSLCFNMGRVLGAMILLIRGSLGSALGLRMAVVALSLLFWVGLGLLLVAPETRGQDLPD
jgi:MFS family permease